MTIGRLIEGRSNEIVTCAADTLVRDAVALLSEMRIGALPVLDGDRVIGIFSERDVIYCLAKHGPSLLDEPVRIGMTAEPHTVTRDTPVLTALAMMTQRRVRHLPVMDGAQMIAIVSIGDLVKYRMDRIESEAEAMRSYIQMA